MKDVGKSERSHRKGNSDKKVNYADLDDWKIEEDYEPSERKKVAKKTPSKNGRGRPAKKGKKTPVKKSGRGE